MAEVWSRDAAIAVSARDPLAVDRLDAVDALVLAGVTADDDVALDWCRRAPCVVIGQTPEDGAPSACVDIAIDLSPSGDAVRTRLLQQIAEHPQASRTLIDVLRVTSLVDARAGLVVESLAYSLLLGGSEFSAWLAAQPRRTPKTFSSPAVRIERIDSELRISLARPENRNAFSAAMRDGMFEALAAAEVDESVDSVALRGDGPVFSSGGDLGEFGSSADLVRAHEVRTQRSVGAALDRLGTKVTAFVHGACVGAGIELSAFAGRVVARPGTTFLLPEVGMGLIPGAGGTVSVTRRVGRQRAGLLALLGEPITVETALEWGLVDAIAD